MQTTPVFFDSHVHIDPEGADEKIIRRAFDAGVLYMLVVGDATETNAAALAVAASYPQNVKAAIGYDRVQAPALTASRLALKDAIETLCAKIRDKNRITQTIVAVGEIGLDFHYAPSEAESQISLMRAQLEAAVRLGLPVIVHSRNAEPQTLNELEHYVRQLGTTDRPGVLHCFTGDCRFVRRLLDLGFFVGFSGIVTFRNADNIREALKMVPEDRLLIETDTPYLAPEPLRGRRNEPAFLPYVAEVVARVRGASATEIAQTTTANARRLFGWMD